MLQRSFMTPEALGLTPDRHAALVEVLRRMEAGEIRERQRKGNYGRNKPPKYFSMEIYHCGTTACLAGWAQYVSGDEWFDPEIGWERGVDARGWPAQLDKLFHWQNADDMIGSVYLEAVTMAEATAALRRYLETGKPFP